MLPAFFFEIQLPARSCVSIMEKLNIKVLWRKVWS
jgi:hypothetical protein